METEQDAAVKSQILDADRAAKKARAHIDKAKRAGIDMSQQESELVTVETRVRRMKEVYLGGK